MKNNQIDNKRILIFGGSGSWGRELITQLLENNIKEVISFARNEYNQVMLKRKFPDSRLKIMIGDVRDYGKVDFACRNIDIVFLLSAIKHVPIAEEFPYETVKTNVNGTRNVIRASITNKVKKVVDVSSDKACLPINLYGMTKAVGEKLILNGANLSKETQFMVIRSGNVLGTRGSVLGLWVNQIRKYNKITLTDERMTRYFLTLPNAIKLLLTALKSNINGGLFITKMPSCKMIDLAEVMIEYYGNKDTEIEVTGIRPGEKIDEVLISKHEIPNAYKYGDNYYLITTNPNKDLKRNIHLNPAMEEYNSRDNLMTKEEIKELLKRGGYLK